MIIPKGTVVTIDGKVYRTLEAQVAWNKEELESLDIEALEALPDQFTELQENVSALSDSVDEVSEDVGDLESDMTDAQSDISGLKDRMDSAETNIGLNAGEITQLQFDLGQAQGDITSLGNSKLDKPTNTGDVGDVIVKTAGGTEFQPVAPFNPNATYPNVTAGKAISAKSLENVSEDSGATQTEPFFFQATATANGTAETPTSPVFNLKSIRGNTIVYNQLVDGVTSTYPTISGHVYWFKHDPLVTLVISTGTDINVPSPQSDKLVDLTRWFNGNIPQAILDDPTVFTINYWNPTAELIARMNDYFEDMGISFRFTTGFDYNVGIIINCDCTEFKTVGFNQWDEEYIEHGGLNPNTGVVSVDPLSPTIASKNFIEVLPNTRYCFTCKANASFRACVYDENETYISALFNNELLNNSFITFVTPANAKYVKFSSIYSTPSYGYTYNHDICINIHWDGARDGEYAPYTPHTYPLVWSGKSAGKDYYGNLAYDEKLPDGTEITRIASTTVGSLGWDRNASGRFYAAVPGAKVGSCSMCSKYLTGRINGSSTMADKTAGFNVSQRIIYVCDLDYDTPEEFKTANSDVVIYYELETPTTSEGTPYTSEIEGDDYGTMAFDSIVPVGNEFFYPADYALLIDDLGNYTGYDVTELAKKSDLIPAPTGADGTYVFKATISGGTVTYFWEAES